MSTIASPRDSISNEGSIKSQPNARRNRAALREFYGLKNASKETSVGTLEELQHTELGPEEDETLVELDAADFRSDAFVNNLLTTESLKGVLKVEADLVSQIRNLDSDRKSLVYDNYSKLLSATSTIRSMRGNMDPLAPTTHTLMPALSHIAEVAASLSTSKPQPLLQPVGLGIDTHIASNPTQDDEQDQKQKQRETVRWILDTPRRLRQMIDQGMDEEAEKEWEEVSRVLQRWGDVAGAKQLREECEGIMEEEEASD